MGTSDFSLSREREDGLLPGEEEYSSERKFFRSTGVMKKSPQGIFWESMKLTGVIKKGVGQGSYFTSLDWVKEQFQKAMGFAPYPGTVNVRIDEGDLSKIGDFFARKDFEIVPTDPKFCAGLFKKVRINGIPGAAVFPSEDVRVHGKEIIEIICGCHLKDTLHLKDGDSVVVTDLQDPS
jgi:riboflavin kinase, archaea type